MNIVEAYTKFNNQNIILISGFSGSRKTKLARFLADLLGFQMVSLNKFHFPEVEYAKEENYVTLKTGTEVLNWDNIYRSIDWDRFNAYIDSQKGRGIVIHGFGFPTKLLKFKPDFHIHVLIRKQSLMDNRAEFIEKHTSENYIKSPEVDRLYLNTIVYPLYISINKESKIDEYVSADDMSEDEMRDKVFGFLMNSIKKSLDQHHAPRADRSTGPVAKIMRSTSENKKPKVHYEGDPGYYDEFYFPDSNRVLYDFNDEGIDYPAEYRTKYNADKESSSSSSSEDFDLGSTPDTYKRFLTKGPKRVDSSSDDSDAIFLYTDAYTG